jgi:hypothetical protein
MNTFNSDSDLVLSVYPDAVLTQSSTNNLEVKFNGSLGRYGYQTYNRKWLQAQVELVHIAEFC